MQSTGAALRLAAHAMVLAFAAVLLVSIGCTGTQASAGAPAAAATVSLAAQLTDAPAPVTVPAPVTALEHGAAVQRLTACMPGRDTARVEGKAIAPAPAALLHSPSDVTGAPVARHWADPAALQLSGRIPAALTHLDLGIVRT